MLKKKKYFIGISTEIPEKGEKYQFELIKECNWTIWQTVPKVQKVIKLSDDIFAIYWGAKVAFVKITRRR